MKYLFALIMLSSCAPRPAIIVDTDFIGYLSKFKSLYDVTDQVSIKKSVLKLPLIGQCDLDNNQVTIDETFWKNATDLSKTALIYHELGHCLLYRAHTEQVKSDGCPSSLMFNVIADDDCLAVHMEEYLTEMKEHQNTLLVRGITGNLYPAFK